MSSYDQEAIARFQKSPVYLRLSQKELIFTVTSGQSGTKLLAVLLSEVLGIAAEHEPPPRANFVLRPTIEDSNYGLKWLIEEKLPVIAALPGAYYAETSHLYCKAFIELLLGLGLNLKFIILRRAATDVARSLFQMNVIPSRTEAGRLVLLSPDDPSVLAPPNWKQFSDYQLCYWYVREIERRQAMYRSQFDLLGMKYFDMALDELTTWADFLRLADFLIPEVEIQQHSANFFQEITSRNQHPRNVAHPDHVEDRPLPDDLAQQETVVDKSLALYFSTLQSTYLNQ